MRNGKVPTTDPPYPSPEFLDSLRYALSNVLDMPAFQRRCALPRLCRRIGTPIDYGTHGWKHAGFFFVANYVKVRTALRQLRLFPDAVYDLEVLDIGAGGGASTIALCDYLRKDINFSRQIRVRAIDHSEAQLEILKSLSIPHLLSLNVEVECVSSDAELFLRKCPPGNFSLCVASYFFSEVAKSKRHRLYKLIRRSVDTSVGSCLIVDDPKGRFTDECERSAKWGSVHRFASKSFLVPSPRSMEAYALKTRYSVEATLFRQRKSVAIGDTSLLPLSLAKYASAWKNRDVDAVSSIFDIDCTYEIQGKRVIRGLAEIVAYWKWLKRTQRRIRFQPIYLRGSNNCFSLDWSARFFRVDLQLWISLHGSMSVEVRDGKIKRLVEYYRRLT